MRRGGFTLVELAGVIIAVGMLLTLSVSLLNQTLAAHRSSLTHLRHIRSLENFVERWREDVQSATEVTTSSNLLVIRSEGSEVTYEFKDQSLIRVRKLTDEEPGQDRWPLPSTGKVNWEVDSSGIQQVLIGKLEFRGDPIEFDDVEFVSRVAVAKGSVAK